MEAATDQTHPAEPAQASSPTTHGGRGPQPYRQDPGSILLAATPIGDVRDASPRVVEALQGADIVAAEDTRRALALASRLGIKLGGRLIALHDHNEAEKAAGIVEAARGGARVVFVSDAGMPTVSDPGFRLARAAIAAGAPVIMVSSATYALIDPSAPALFSSTIVTDMLRREMGFSGVVITDDVSAAVQVQDVSAGDRAVRAIRAGCDIVLASADPTVAADMVKALIATARSDPAFAARVDESATRVLNLKKNLQS